MRVPTDDEWAGLVGHRFRGGRRTVEHWENWLLTDCTRRRPMADGLLHPVVLFHLPIQAARTSVAELFELGASDGAPGSVTLLGYDWEYLAPMREGVEYEAVGGVVEATRRRTADLSPEADDLAFAIELLHDAGPVARVTNRWRFRRIGRAPHAATPLDGRGSSLGELVVDDVGVDRMKTMAALIRDPYPIHWDPDAVRAAGLGDRPVNQGPLNLAYVANLLMERYGDGSIRRLTVAFHGRVHAGDTVTAGGTVEEAMDVGAERRHRCIVWLDRDGTRLVSGTAEVAVAEP
jgi:acyl dehydratase